MKDLDKKDEQIIRMISEGMTAKEIGPEVGLTRRGVEERLLRLRRQHDCKSSSQLAIKLLTSVNDKNHSQ